MKQSKIALSQLQIKSFVTGFKEAGVYGGFSTFGNSDDPNTQLPICNTEMCSQYPGC
jgi:hypothetical protein